jgi:CPA1 family monovalent cation:H+ antiporter
VCSPSWSPASSSRSSPPRSARRPPVGVAFSEHSPLARNEEYTRLRLALLDRKRERLLRLRHDGSIDDSVARRLQTRLDIEELRLTGVEPLG